MSVATTAPAWQDGLQTLTVRQFGRAVAFALLAVGAGCLIYLVETVCLRARPRLVENPTDVMMRAFGLAHFAVGWLFLFTSPRLRGPRAVGGLLAAIGLGVGACWLFTACGASRQPFALMLFYGYFLIHEIRDEAHLFRAYGDAPARGPDSDRRLDALSWAVALLALTVLAGAFLLHAVAFGKTGVLARLSPLLGLCGTAALLTATAWACWRVGRLVRGDWHGLAATHRPLLVVYAGLLALLLLGTLLGSVGLNLVILLHVTAWLVFVHYQLGRRPPAPSRGLWPWLRTSPAGFVVLHLAAVGLFLLLMALRVHVWQRSGWVSDLVARSSFPYWSLMHISMAFWRPR
jgi:hypothetical protein